LVNVGLVLALLAPQSSAPMAQAQEGTNPPVLAFGLPAEGDLERFAALAVNDVPPILPDELDLGPVAAAAFAQADAMPEGDWTVPGLATALEYDPVAAFSFVRDRIAFDPYPGVLRGPTGTLAARAGNAWDRAALLSALLGEMLIPTRYAFADLDTATAERLVERAREPVALPLETPGMEIVPMFEPAAVRDRATRDYARLRAGLGDTLAGPGPLDETVADAIEAVRAHVWVQAAWGTEWLDMDPTLPTATVGDTVAAPSSRADVLPEETRQTVTLRLVVGQADATGLTEVPVLEQVLDPVLLEGSEVFLYFEPRYDGIGGSILSALSGEQPWTPILMVDGTTTVGSPFSVGGRGTDLFGDAVDSPALVSMRLVVERHTPAGSPEQAERVLLDRVPAGAQEVTPDNLEPLSTDAAGPVVLGQVHHVMISTGSASSRDYAALRGLVADFADQELLGEEEPFFSFADVLWPVAVTDQALVVASERAVVPSLADALGWRAFVDAPRVYLASFGPDPTGEGIRFETDLLLDGVALLAPRGEEPIASRVRQLWYGALQTALESEFVRVRSGALVSEGRQLGGASFSMGLPLTRLTPSDTPPISGTRALEDAMLQGQVLLVPGPVESAAVWWTVDPATGVARSVLDPGLAGGYGKVGGGAGTRDFKRPIGGNRPGAGGADKGQYSPARHNKLPNGCRPGQEYVALVGCVSVPAAQAIRYGVGTAVSIAVAIAGAVLAGR
jgi:hypothetical protein